MTTYYAKKDDANITIGVTLYDSLGPVNLTGCTVSWIMHDGATATSITGTLGNQTTHPGSVSIVLTAAHLAAVAAYNVEWQVTCGANITTFPSDSYDRLIVTADLS